MAMSTVEYDLGQLDKGMATTITLSADKELVVVDATAQV